jgi:hypothetical protein
LVGLCFLAVILFLVEPKGGMSAFAAQSVDRLMGGNREQPGADRSAGFVLIDLGIKLKKSVLEDIVGEITVSEIAAQIAEERALITANQCAECLSLALPKKGEQVLIGTVGEWSE